MQKTLLLKFCMVGGLLTLLMVPIGMIDELISERAAYRDEARNDIASSWTGPQRVVGPLLVLPYVEQGRTRRHGRLVILPETLTIASHVESESRQRGLHRVPVYTANLAVSGSFTTAPAARLGQESKSGITWQTPYLAIFVSDLRGILRQPTVQWAGQRYAFQSGDGLDSGLSGMHAPLGPVSAIGKESFEFAIDFVLRGMESIGFAPVGRDTRVTMTADWPDPGFTGRYLPAERDIAASGFTAEWLVSSFSSEMHELAERCGNRSCDGLLSNTFGVSLADPIDVYRKSERSVKYAMLFLSLTFGFFFLYEMVRNLAVHPVQYLFVGLALSVFYLLLVSLSEHLAFALAYAIAAGACSSLLGVYVGAVLGSARGGFAFFVVMAILYAVLYLILRSEDNALLMGSMLMFGVLASAMVVTRKIDWYALQPRVPQAEPQDISSGDTAA